MLKNSRAFSGFSMDDVEKAETFYRSTLGLNVKDSLLGLLELHLEGNNPIIVYPKPDPRPATFTVLNFPVEDMGVAVDALSKRGISF